MNNFFHELKRRNVVRVGVAYLVIGWVLMQVAGSLEAALTLPDWFDTFIVGVLIIGFPLALFLSWAYEMTPAGVKKTEEVDADPSISPGSGQKLNYVIMAGLVLALGYFMFDKYMTVSEVEIVPVEVAVTEKTIAVLPFVNMSNDPEQEFFSDGISEELLNVLAKVEGLRVTSRTSAFAFKGTNTPIPQVAAELGVQYVLEGSVRRGGGKVRITTQLIDVATDSHLWSETYDRDMANIFAVQDEIAGRVAEALKVALLGADHQPIAPVQTTAIEVYTDFLLARQKLASFTFEPMKEAERLLKRVIVSDPAFAPAYEVLAGLYLDMAQIGILSESELILLARPIINAALALDDRLAGIWLANAYILAFEGTPDQAAAARERAYALEPNHPNILRDQLLQSSWSRHPDDMAPVIDVLYALDPLSTQTFVTVDYWYARQTRFEDMRRTQRRLLETQPGSPVNLFWSGITPLPEDSNARKIEDSRNFKALEPNDPEGPSFLALFLLDAGETTDVALEIGAARALDEDHAHVAIADALYNIYRGEEEEALRIAETLAEPEAPTRWGSRDMALRMLATRALASPGVVEAKRLIPLYLAAHPGLDQAKLDSTIISPVFYVKWGHLMAALDLAALYEKTGEGAKSEALKAAVATELTFWPRRGVFGIGIADAELYALRGDDAAALAALRQAAEDGWTSNWWWFLDHSPHLAPLRGTSEFAAIRADFAARAALPPAGASE